MTIDEAIDLLKIQYAKAKTIPWVKTPLAYALYKVWKVADKKADWSDEG